MTPIFIIGFMTLCAGLLQGVTGFGGGIVMMMILPSFFPLNQAAGVSGAISLTLCASMAFRYRKNMKIKKVLLPAVLYLTSSGISIYFSTMINQAVMKKVFGGFLVILSLYYLFLNKNQNRKLSLSTSILFITVSGICDGLFGIGGPLMVIYYLSQSSSKEEYFANIQGLFCINLVYSIGLRVYNHLLTAEHLPYIGVGAICILIGLAAANSIVDGLDGEKLKKITYVVIGVSGILNII